MAAPARTWAIRAIAALLAASVAGAIAIGVAGAIRDTEAAGRAAEAFLASLRRGDVDGAYDGLTAARRATMTREAFRALTDHPAFRAHESIDLRPAKQKVPGRCSYGHLRVGGRDWAVELYTLEEGGAFRVHSFAILPPAPVQLGVLLPECGFSSGTLVGYAGPPIERTTPPTAP